MILAVLILTMGGFAGATLMSRWIAKSVNEDAVSIATNAAPAIQDLVDARSELARIAIAAASAIASEPENADARGATLPAALLALRDDLRRYLLQPFYPREEARYAEADRATRLLEARVSDFEAALAAGDRRRAAEIAKAGLLPAVSRVDRALSDVILFNTQEQRRLAFEILARRGHAHRMEDLLQALTAICGLLLMSLVFRGIRDYARLLARARAASRARDDLLATVSHDLRNPIYAIALTVRAIRRGSPGAGIEKQIARIERATERMNRLIEDLLAAARIEAGVLRADRKPEDASRLMEAAVEMFRPGADEKSVRIGCQPPAAAAPVSCDRHLILRVLSNIIGNALKFSPRGGTITVKAERLAGEVQFTVRDEGPGIPPEDRRHVFDRYWHQKKGNGAGTGLGLYIAKGIVDAHGGRIWLEEGGPGTIVSFTLPVERSA
ncbi:MAG TPA: HAMP domain-containing sensor histidine kinase [Polyangia bacterium]